MVTTNENGIFLGQRLPSFQSQGICAGRKRSMPSTVLMDVIPAKVAG